MVAQFYKFLTQSVEDIHKAAYVLASFSLFSQILALVRDRLFASTFGASETLDLYYAAFRIPDLLYVSVASVVSLGALVPLLVHKIDENKEEAKRFIDGMFTFFLVFIGTVCAVLFFLVPTVVPVLFPGFESPEAQAELVLLIRILLLQPIFLGLSSLLAGVTHVYKKFLVYSIGLLLYNVGIILGLLFLYPTFGLAGLGMGVVFGAIMQFLIQIPAIAREGFAPRPRFSLKKADLKEVLALSIPRTITLSAAQLVMLALISLASLLEEGSITVFNFSYNLQSVPLTIIGVSYSVAAFPTLARLYSEGKTLLFARQIASAARHIIFWSLPAMVLFIVLRAQIVRVVLGAGEFSWSDTRLTAATLGIFSISIVAQALILLFIRGYYAAGKTKRPLLIVVVSSLLTLVFAFLSLALVEQQPEVRYFLESLFRVEGLSGTRVLILALVYSMGQIFSALMLWYFFSRDFKEFAVPVRSAFLHSLSSSVFIGFVSYLCLGIFDNIFDINTFIGIFLQGLLSGVVGIVAGIILLNLLRNREILEIQRALHSRFSSREVIIPDDITQR
ncbi:MAG: murein biosynthesis integral membrane protein MurJ [Candidatus Paceibacterota bacterium]